MIRSQKHKRETAFNILLGMWRSIHETRLLCFGFGLLVDSKNILLNRNKKLTSSDYLNQGQGFLNDT